MSGCVEVCEELTVCLRQVSDVLVLLWCRDLQSGGGHAPLRRQHHRPVHGEVGCHHGQSDRTEQSHHKPRATLLRRQTGHERGSSR